MAFRMDGERLRPSSYHRLDVLDDNWFEMYLSAPPQQTDFERRNEGSLFLHDFISGVEVSQALCGGNSADYQIDFDQLQNHVGGSLVKDPSATEFEADSSGRLLTFSLGLPNRYYASGFHLLTCEKAGES